MTTTEVNPELRIASLLPSTTDICISLGLKDHIVGITHECDFPLSKEDDKNDKEGTLTPTTLTISHINLDAQTQLEIDSAVKSSLRQGLSLYNLAPHALDTCRPSIILTQSLCEVCAVDKAEVDREVAAAAASSSCGAAALRGCRVLSLEPNTLREVVDTFVEVAECCGVKERGEALKRSFWENAEKLRHAWSKHDFEHDSEKKRKRPSVLFLEWLDPPFDGGHWIPDMLTQSGCRSALKWSDSKKKSVQLTWEQVYDCNPDVVVVACCGFDLARNQKDALLAARRLRPLRAFHEGRIYATDGNLYFARPGPKLLNGMAILARCAFDGRQDVVHSLDQLDFLPDEGRGWSRMLFPSPNDLLPDAMPDMEDLVSEGNYSQLHEEACRAGKQFYKDPQTGYSVFTELAHKKRGKCCGSGCRHCPFNHSNVKDKTQRIQQPAFLYEGQQQTQPTQDIPPTQRHLLFAPLSAIPPNSHVKVLFFSGGKDSFLAIRKLVQLHLQNNHHFYLILLTTFDATSRIIAHQELPIDTVLRQARHLNIPLLGIPLRRGSGETYLSRIQKGLDLITNYIPNVNLTLAFGDLHLNHIRQWRDNELSNYPLEYPLWKIPYDQLMDDLEKSKVRVVLSASTEKGAERGIVFTRDFYNNAIQLGMDGFGENGEFHSVAQVWTVKKEVALGYSY